MNADDLRAPLTERERKALLDSCRDSGVPVKITDPVALSRVGALLRDWEGDHDASEPRRHDRP